MMAADGDAIRSVVAEFVAKAGERAGVPDETTSFKDVPPGLDAGAAGGFEIEIWGAFGATLARIEREAWWRGEPDPASLKAPLRAVADVVEGCLAARRAGCEGPDRLLASARSGADFLLAAQRQAGEDCFPFPASGAMGGKLGGMAELALDRAKAAGRAGSIVTNGWFVSDEGRGDLKFDNGVAGVAVLRFYEATKEAKYLEASIAAGRWAMRQTVVPNWNYNSFSVWLLAELHRVTGEAAFLEAAKREARLGILPGQLVVGPHVGRWVDPHNARLVYHMIILRGLGALASQLREGDPDLAVIGRSLGLGLRALASESDDRRIPNPDTYLEVLTRLRSWGVGKTCGDPALVEELFGLGGRYATGRYRTVRVPFTPAAWGLYLEVRHRAPGSSRKSEADGGR